MKRTQTGQFAPSKSPKIRILPDFRLFSTKATRIAPNLSVKNEPSCAHPRRRWHPLRLDVSARNEPNPARSLPHETNPIPVGPDRPKRTQSRSPPVSRNEANRSTTPKPPPPSPDETNPAPLHARLQPIQAHPPPVNIRYRDPTLNRLFGVALEDWAGMHPTALLATIDETP